jgi:succinate dehydrogenase / fumarate reductase iron-sulfur subunit
MTVSEARKKQPVFLMIKRADGPRDTPRWEEFEVPWMPQMNVISALMFIQKHPITSSKKPTTPVVWEQACLEEVCGSCTMVINGRVRQACTALIDRLSPHGEMITLEPMTKFPLIRDLIVDRSRMFEQLKKVKAWIEIDGSHAQGPGPRQSSVVQEITYPLSRCMTCGCCVEACPNVSSHSPFVGPFVISQVRLFNLHPLGKLHAGERLDAIMDDSGLEGCGKAMNCVEVCPKDIPLVESIAAMNGEALKQSLFGWLFK